METRVVEPLAGAGQGEHPGSTGQAAMTCEVDVAVPRGARPGRKCNRLSGEQWIAIQRLVGEGHTYAAVARRLGLAESTVRVGAQRHGWKPRDTRSKAELAIEERLEAKRVAWVERSLETWERLAEAVSRGIAGLAGQGLPAADAASVWTSTWHKLDSGARAALGLANASCNLTVTASRSNILVAR